MEGELVRRWAGSTGGCDAPTMMVRADGSNYRWRFPHSRSTPRVGRARGDPGGVGARGVVVTDRFAHIEGPVVDRGVRGARQRRADTRRSSQRAASGAVVCSTTQDPAVVHWPSTGRAGHREVKGSRVADRDRATRRGVHRDELPGDGAGGSGPCARVVATPAPPTTHAAETRLPGGTRALCVGQPPADHHRTTTSVHPQRDRGLRRRPDRRCPQPWSRSSIASHGAACVAPCRGGDDAASVIARVTRRLRRLPEVGRLRLPSDQAVSCHRGPRSNPGSEHPSSSGWPFPRLLNGLNYAAAMLSRA